MRLTLLVPGLLLPPAIRSDILFDLSAPALARLLGRARRTAVPGDWLPAAFGLDAPLPAAALRQAAAQVDTGTGIAAEAASPPKGIPGEGAWLCLDPVHLRVTREGILLDDPAALALTADEALALRATVAPLFVDWGDLCASAPGRWELRLSHLPALETRPLDEAIDQPVPAGLPGGAEGRAWRCRIAEAQTLLHGHAVNRAREERGLLPVNSLWPWGGGERPVAVCSDFTAVHGDDPVVAGLCALAGLPCQPLQPQFSVTAGHLLAIDNRFSAPARKRDALAFRDQLLGLERDWIAPVMRESACREFHLVGTGSGLPALIFSITRNRMRLFWKRSRSLVELG